jgi:hypothetical protein
MREEETRARKSQIRFRLARPTFSIPIAALEFRWDDSSRHRGKATPTGKRAKSKAP